jgi:putative hydrolase of the HAD superfamily
MEDKAALEDADALLFDLGGVLIEIDWRRAFSVWAESAGTTADSIAGRFTFDAAYAAHERGEIGAAEYFASLRRTLGMGLSDEQFLAGWNAIFVGEVACVRELLAAAAARRPLYLFSNTCEVHRDHWMPRFEALLQPFSRCFLSCEIGLRKPDPQAFAHVARAIGLAPQRIAFFDDTAENVAGAARAGLAAHQVRSAAELAAALRLSA